LYYFNYYKYNAVCPSVKGHEEIFEEILCDVGRAFFMPQIRGGMSFSVTQAHV